MDASDCLQVLRRITEASFATVDEHGNPQVRIIDVMLVEDEKLIFCTARGKNFYKELMATQKVAVVALCRDYSTIRLNGKAERLKEQKEWIDKIFEAKPVMNNVYPGDARYILEVFCIPCGEIEYFELRQKPIRRTSYAFGGAEIAEKGFTVTNKCIGCGKCVQLCPQKSIDAGTLAFIHSENCLHCGYCYESCPVQAIKRK
ncbi:MAG: 4Fe-4S binding protein [Oscillospiraceae bacterium]|nr:4Fe-4S binding protein [Oscillospiraceae bacterium]